jgi:hypothetical protein
MLKKKFQGLNNMDIRGLYIVEGTSYPDFVELENRGLTSVFYKDSFILNDYTVCKKNLNELTDALAPTNLKLAININGFKASDQSSLVDPTNKSHRNTLKQAIITLLEDFPDVTGISFDDFHWHSWDGYTDVQKSDILAEFAKEMSETIHNTNPSIEVSASLNWKAHTLPSTASELDYIIPKINISNSSGIPLSKAIKTIKEETDAEVVIELLTYDSAVNLEPRTLSDIYNEISTVISVSGPNYCLNASPWIPFGLGFPKEDYSFTEVNIDLNMVSKRKTITEKSSRILTINFLDQNNNSLSDDLLKTIAGKYKISDQSTGKIIKDFTAFIPDNSVYELTLSSDDNKIVNPDVSQENHIVTVSIVYGNGKTENNEITITILNLTGIN